MTNRVPLIYDSAGEIEQLQSGDVLDPSILPIATTSTTGTIKPDGTTITISSTGVTSTTGVTHTDSTITGSGTSVSPLSVASSALSITSNQVTTALGFTPVKSTTTVNGHTLSSNVTVSASDITTGTLPYSVTPVDSTASDYNMNGTASAGSVGKLSDSGHIHPRSTFTYYATMSANQSTAITAGSPLKFNTLSSDSSPNAPAITISGSNYQLTLPTGFKYEFICQIYAGYSGSTGALISQMYNNTSSVYVGIADYGNTINSPNTADDCTVFIGEISNTSGSNIMASAVIRTVTALSDIWLGATWLKITATKL